MDKQVSHSTFVHIMNVAIERRHKCLTVGGEEEGRCGCGVVSSTEAFPTVGLALQLEVPTMVTSIPGLEMGEECWNSGLDGRLEAMAASIHLEAVVASIQLEAIVAAMSKAAQLQETLPRASRVLDPYENPVT
jgi:hypothetical protein